MPDLQSSSLSLVTSALCSSCFFAPFFLDVLCPLIALKPALLWAGDWTNDLQKSLSTKIFQWSYDYLIITTFLAFWQKLLRDSSSIKIFNSFTVVYECTPKWIYSSLTLCCDFCLPSLFYALVCSLFICFVSFLSFIQLSSSHTSQNLCETLKNKAPLSRRSSLDHL